ncbi:ABC transporter ATP-binding protein [Clostridium grantii]|uniref:ABC-2 type transport system ATP-binding protein n=1 Tax=Clostridium grantii DSM 8605 TaxID=1121316 RepID=A0A1M5U480_9CLOT|nr:ABC transporter ATP-binding protein [Clostridium grantii]SHH57666.1 ABC-2 type transport system ATP-binding protein [Clostridium grantii DSM 8605]
MDFILETKDLTKKYGSKIAVDNLNFQLERGKILGLLGPNGSGKTTFIKMLVGLLHQDNGEILIDGKVPGVETKKTVAYLPDRNFLYKWMKIKDAIEVFSDFYEDFNIDKCKKLLEFMKLEENMKIKALSKGMTEKLLLTLVLSRDAQLYVLDEPIAGVDPVAREKILDAILNNFNEGSSMIITTHLVRDIEKLFDEVAFISEGKIFEKGDAEQLRIDKGMSIDEIYRDIFRD